MKMTAILVAAMVLSGSAMGCGSSRASDEHAAEAKAAITAQSLAGKWKFVYTDARRAAIEAQLAQKISDATALAEAKKEAADEAAASEIEFTADGTFKSRISGEVILEATYNAVPNDHGLDVTMRVGGNNQSTSVDFPNETTIVIHDPNKGPLTFVKTP